MGTAQLASGTHVIVYGVWLTRSCPWTTFARTSTASWRAPVHRFREYPARLLAFTVEKTLAGEPGQTRNIRWGSRPGRKESFDPRTDAIVRAWKLRERLLAYYESEGAQEYLRIEYRKGSYVPSSRRSRRKPPCRDL